MHVFPSDRLVMVGLDWFNWSEGQTVNVSLCNTLWNPLNSLHHELNLPDRLQGSDLNFSWLLVNGGERQIRSPHSWCSQVTFSWLRSHRRAQPLSSLIVTRQLRNGAIYPALIKWGSICEVITRIKGRWWAPAFALTLGRADRSVRVEEFIVKRKKEREMISPHSLMGSSDKSLQSFTLSHTLLLSIHSPFLQRNFLGPSHFVTENATKKKTEKCCLSQWFKESVISDMDAGKFLDWKSRFPQFFLSETIN